MADSSTTNLQTCSSQGANRGSGLDEDGFARLLAEQESRLRAFLRRLARHPAGQADGDDLVQEVFARAWRSRCSLDLTAGRPASWLLKIAFRVFLDHRDRDQRGGMTAWEPGIDPADAAPSPAQAAEDRDWQVSLLAQLRPIERDVLLGFHDRGLSVLELAAELGMPAGTVKSHLHRARVRLWDAQRREDAR